MTASAHPGTAPRDLTLPPGAPLRRRRSTPPGGSIPPGGRWSVPGGGPAQPTGWAWWPRLQFAVAAALILGLFATILAPMDDGLFGGIGNDATPTADTTANPAPSIGYPNVATSDSGLVDLPLSASGHTVTIDRVLLEPDTTFELPAGSVYFTDTKSGVGTSRNPNPSSQTSEPSGLDVLSPIENGGSLQVDADQTAIVTILRIAPEGIPPLASGIGVTVFPMTSYTTGEYRFETQVSIVFGSGPVPMSPEQVGPLRADGVPFSDGQGISLNGATMLLYAGQGSIQLTSQWDSISVPASGNEYGSGVRELRLEAGTAAVTRDPFLTIQQASPGEDASYTVAFISPPPIDQTTGRTYPNTRNSVFGSIGQTPIATDGSDYRIVLDRLTLQPGAIAAFSAGTYRAIQWTGGGDVAMVVGGGGQSPFLFPNMSLGGSFGDQSFSLVANGGASVTLTLMSWMPADAFEETVPMGQEGLNAERLSAYTDTNPFNTEQLQLSFYAAAANGFPIEIDPGTGLNIGGASTVDSYALIRPEDGPIVLNRPARRIIDGAEATEIAAGNAVLPGETVRVDDLRDATLQGPTDGTPAGYTLVVVSPYSDPYVSGTGSAPPMVMTGLTPASLDTVADIPTDQPLNIAVIRHTLQPDARLTVRPNGDTLEQDGEWTDSALILSYVVDGSGTVDSPNRDTIELANRSSDLAAVDITTAAPLAITAGHDGLTLYQIIIGTGRPALSDSRNVSSLFLGSFTTDSLMTTSDVPGNTVGARATLRVAVGLGADDGQTLGNDSAFTVMTPLIGDALLTSDTGEPRVTGPGDDAASAILTAPLVVPVGGAILIDPGAEVRMAPAEARLSVLWADIRIAPGGSTTYDATPIEGTPVSAPPDGTWPLDLFDDSEQQGG